MCISEPKTLPQRPGSWAGFLFCSAWAALIRRAPRVVWSTHLHACKIDLLWRWEGKGYFDKSETEEKNINIYGVIILYFLWIPAAFPVSIFYSFLVNLLSRFDKNESERWEQSPHLQLEGKTRVKVRLPTDWSTQYVHDFYRHDLEPSEEYLETALVCILFCLYKAYHLYWGPAFKTDMAQSSFRSVESNPIEVPQLDLRDFSPAGLHWSWIGNAMMIGNLWCDFLRKQGPTESELVLKWAIGIEGN